ncbi:MAG: S8 family serine peptidase, partial [bacterium]
MSRHIFLAIILLINSLVAGEEMYYHAGGEKIYLIPYKDRISVTWQKDLTTEEKEVILRSKPEIKSWYHIEKYDITILAVDESKSQMLLVEFWLHPQVEFASFILHTSQNDSLIIQNELIVKLTPEKSIDEIKSHYQTELLREDPFDEAYKILKVNKSSQFNALEIANMLTEQKKVVYACPNFIRRIEMHREPNDEYYDYQWALPKIGAPTAWDYATGSSSIKIAIIDGGIDLGHPDLQNAIVTGYDAVDGDNTPQCNSTDGHGTCCAGIAAAIVNNEEGVAGIAGGWGGAGGCRIMPIRIYSGNTWVSDDDIKYCFEWATNQGAKVLSNSWGYSGYHYSDPVHDGIKYAYDHGRLVCFSSGNSNEYVHYPAADEFSMAVGATNENDERCSYSCYGYNLDITAPSGDYGFRWIYSTDNRGGGGYSSGDYYPNFGGTSAACPQVTGLAGLLFSANSNLENFDIERIIKIFANDRPPSGWDEYTGYGRIDAGNAVKHVILPYEITKGTASPPSLVISNVWRSFMNRPRPEMAPGTYLCDVYKMEMTINFSPTYAEAPWGWFSFTGYANENPNYCTEYLYHSSSTTSITLRTYFYWIKTNQSGDPINKWAPTSPSSYATKYTILGRKPINTPSNLQATELPFSNNIRVTWQDNSHNELKFKIYRSTGGDYSLYDSVAQNITQYIDVNTTPGQWYSYFVMAWAQEFCSGSSNGDWAIAGLAPPTLYQPVDVPPNQARVSWQNSSNLTIVSYTVSRWNDVTNQWNDTYKTGLTTTSFNDTVTFLHKYKYRVKAQESGGHYSDWSNTVEYTSGLLAQSDYPKMSA